MIFNENRWHRSKVKTAWLEKAKTEAPKYEQNHGHGTVAIREDRETISIIGREKFREWAAENSIVCTIGEFVDKQFGDKNDVLLGGFNCDIKTQIKDANQWYLSSGTVHIFENQIGKEMDVYIFAGWEKANGDAVLFGWCTRAYFLRYCYKIPEGTMLGNFQTRWTSFNLEMKRLMPIADLSAENIEWMMKKMVQ